MGITKATKNVINYQEIVDITIKDAGIAGMNERADAADKKNLEQEIRLNYLEGRQSASSNFTSELFLDELKTNPTYEYSSNPAEIMDDNDWNNNWKETELDSPSFKNGFMRPRQTPYMLENIDEYNLDGIGQAYKCGMSQYDSTNDCYWMISNGSGSNTVGEITKLGSSLKDGRVEVMGRWYLPAYSAGIWTGIDSDGTVLYLSDLGTGALSAQTSGIWTYLINTNGTLGQSNAPSGSRLAPNFLTTDATVDTTNGSPILAMDSTAQLRVGMWVSEVFNTHIPASSYIISINSLTSFTINQNCVGGTGTNITMTYFDSYGSHPMANSGVDTGYYNDVVVLDSSTLGVLCCNATTNVNIVKLALPGLTLASNSITGLANFVGGTLSSGRSITISGNDIYIKINDATDDKRFIYKFNLTSDIISYVAIKSSGRFDPIRNIDGQGNEGIGVSREGDILEVTSTASNGKFIARRAVRNALWAENQVNGETIPITAATAPTMCMVDANGDYWTSDYNAGTIPNNTAKMYRYQISTGTISSVTFTNIGAGTNGIVDACHDGTNVYIAMYYSTGTISRVAKGTLANLISSLGSSIAVGSGGWAYLAAPNAANTIVLNGIAYDSDAGVLLVITPGTLFITTLATDGTSWLNTYKLPTAIYQWKGCSYKNGNIYINDSPNATTPTRTYIFNKAKGTTTTWFISHRYQDPSGTFVAVGQSCTDFSGNDLVSMNYTTKQFTKMKTLEDPDVMQLHTFLDAHNVLLETGVSSMSPVTERYFEPDEFADIRDCPDKQYMVVGYTSNGFSELHLDEFLAGKSTTGKDRYDVSKIRTRHYKEGATNVILIAAAQTSQVLIEKDIIIVSDFAAAGVIKVIDLKAGTSTALYTSTNSGWKYAGTLTQRNDSRSYAGVLNAELNISHSIVHQLSARTFTKEDASSYTYQNPRTYVGISMAAAGMDVLVIDWDSNNNRTCLKVYNNVANSICPGAYGHFISPSGTVYMPNNVSSGTLYKGLFPIWQLNTDAGYAYDSTQKSIVLGGTTYTYPNLISRSSTCYKKSSGEWTDILLYTNRSTEAVMLCNTSSLFNSPSTSYAALGSFTLVYSSSQDGFNDVDNYEDKIFFASHENTSGGLISNLTITRRLTFNDNNTHMSATGANYNGFTSLERINSVSRPRMNPASIWVSNEGLVREKDIRFSPLVNKLAFGNIVKGLILFHFYNQDQCTHQSIDFDAENPSSYLYKQSIKN